MKFHRKYQRTGVKKLQRTDEFSENSLLGAIILYRSVSLPISEQKFQWILVFVEKECSRVFIDWRIGKKSVPIAFFRFIDEISSFTGSSCTIEQRPRSRWSSGILLADFISHRWQQTADCLYCRRSIDVQGGFGPDNLTKNFFQQKLIGIKRRIYRYKGELILKICIIFS